jgi:hypothetical protein
VGGQHHAPATLPRGKRTSTHFIGGCGGPKAGLGGCGKSRRTGIRFPYRPACSQSLYRLRYSSPQYLFVTSPILISISSTYDSKNRIGTLRSSLLFSSIFCYCILRTSVFTYIFFLSFLNQCSCRSVMTG